MPQFSFGTLALQLYECVKVPMPAHQALPLRRDIFELSYSISGRMA